MFYFLFAWGIITIVCINKCIGGYDDDDDNNSDDDNNNNNTNNTNSVWNLL